MSDTQIREREPTVSSVLHIWVSLAALVFDVLLEHPYVARLLVYLVLVNMALVAISNVLTILQATGLMR